MVKKSATRAVPATRKRSPARATRESLAPAEDPKLVVGLQVTIAISGHDITLETPDVAQLKKGIQFELAQPLPLGTLAEFLEWAKSPEGIPGFPSDIDPASWPKPFDDLAQMGVTIEEFCINNQVTPALYTIAVTISSATGLKLPVIPVSIKLVGVKVAKGDCSKSINSGNG